MSAENASTGGVRAKGPVVASAPEGMPVLTKGRHRSPREGACLMEYVSVLAGESFSDRPRCVDPLIVGLAWAVNDASADDVRSLLPDLAPSCIGTAGGGLLVAPTVVAACCTFARDCLDGGAAAPLSAEIEQAEARLRRLRKRAASGRPCRGERLYRGLHAELVLQQVARAVASERADQLPRLLSTVVSAARNVLAETRSPAGRAGSPQPA